MGHHKDKYLREQREQRRAARENKAYYQNESDWKHTSTEREISERRREPTTTQPAG